MPTLVQTNLSPVCVKFRRVNRAEIKLIVLWLLRHLFSVQVCFVQRNFWRIQSFRASKNYNLHNSRIFVWLTFKHKYVIYVGMTKGRVTNQRVISESYDFGELCSNHAQTSPTFPNDHTNFVTLPTFPWTNMRELCLT
jgi:hypothetical protein